MNILLMRHGESVGNVDEANYITYQDHGIPLTERGWRQSIEAGQAVRAFAKANGIEQFRVWYSPYKRTVQTKDALLIGLGDDLVERVYEDERLREQDFGLFSDIHDPAEQERLFPQEYAKYQRLKAAQGKSYARAPDGESRVDVAFRGRQFTETMMRDAREGVRNVIIVSHGVTVRGIEMGFLHRGVDWFENSKNPRNDQITRIFGSRANKWQSEILFEGFKARKKHDLSEIAPVP